MQRIELNLASDLKINDNNQLTFHISSDSGNTLILREAGLYAPASTVNTNDLYPNGEMEGILIGAKGPWGGYYDLSYTWYSGEVSVASCVHRTYTCLKPTSTENGTYVTFPATSLIDMRECDYVAPGDFIRVPDGGYQLGDDLTNAKFFYYIVTSAARVLDEYGYPLPHNDVLEAYLIFAEAC